MEVVFVTGTTRKMRHQGKNRQDDNLDNTEAKRYAARKDGKTNHKRHKARHKNQRSNAQFIQAQ